jgi:hypothetical protein
LTGNQKFHTHPATTPAAPATNIAVTFSSGVRRERKRCPVSTPQSVVATAGIVLRTPSGSYRGFQVCPASSSLSTYEARLPAMLKSPAAEPGAATSVNKAQ